MAGKKASVSDKSTPSAIKLLMQDHQEVEELFQQDLRTVDPAADFAEALTLASIGFA